MASRTQNYKAAKERDPSVKKPGRPRLEHSDPYIPKPQPEFTQPRRERYLQLLRETGLKYRSAELVGVTSYTINAHRQRFPEFDQACEEAHQAFLDDRLLAAAHQRAIDGVEEPIIGGKDRDLVVAHKRNFSDNLALALLRAGRAEFRSGEGGEAGGKSANTLIVPSAPMSVDDWEQTQGEAAKGQGGKPK